jgi:hypothetical protein
MQVTIFSIFCKNMLKLVRLQQKMKLRLPPGQVKNGESLTNRAFPALQDIAEVHQMLRVPQK